MFDLSATGSYRFRKFFIEAHRASSSIEGWVHEDEVGDFLPPCEEDDDICNQFEKVYSQHGCRPRLPDWKYFHIKASSSGYAFFRAFADV